MGHLVDIAHLFFSLFYFDVRPIRSLGPGVRTAHVRHWSYRSFPETIIHGLAQWLLGLVPSSSPRLDCHGQRQGDFFFVFSKVVGV